MFTMPQIMQKALSQRDAFLVLGRVGMDLYPKPDGTKIEDASEFASDIGGSAGNIAVALARAGHKVALISGLSDDGVGRFVRRALANYRVSCDYVGTTTGQERTSLALAETVPLAPNVVIYRNNAADLILDEALLAKIDFAATKALVITGTALSTAKALEQIITLARAARLCHCPVMIDLDYRAMAWPDEAKARASLLSLLPDCDVVIGNDDEFAVLGACPKDQSEAVARKMAQEGQLILYKKGEKGCDALYGDAHFATGIFSVSLKKPFGAGDAFLGNLLGALANQDSLGDAIQKGSAAAAMVVSQAGCASAMPSVDQLCDFISSNQCKTVS